MEVIVKAVGWIPTVLSAIIVSENGAGDGQLNFHGAEAFIEVNLTFPSHMAERNEGLLQSSIFIKTNFGQVSFW